MAATVDNKSGAHSVTSPLPPWREKTKHPLGTSCKLFPLHAWLYFLYIALAILLPIFGTLLIICGNWSSTGYFSLFAILNYPWPKLKLEDPNYTATSLELLQVSLSTKINLRPPPSVDLLDLRFLLLVLLSLPRLRHRRLPQASLVGNRQHHHYHHHESQRHHLCLHQGQEAVGQASLGRRPQSCRRGASQGEGDLLAHGIDDFFYIRAPMDGLYVCTYVYSESGEGRDGHGAVWEDGQGAAGGDEEVRKARVGEGARRQEDSLTQ